MSLRSVIGAAPPSAVRLRLFVCVGLVIGLHATLLLSVRPTLTRSGAHESQSMFVRLLTAMPSASAEQTQAAQPGAEVQIQLRDSVPEVSAKTGSRFDDASANTLSADMGAKGARAGVPPTLPAPPVAPAPQPANNGSLPPAPSYRPGGILDPGPIPLDDIQPTYPEEANLQEGAVVLRLLINEAGTVDNVAVVRSYPQGLFERSALEAFGRARFSPGMLLGIPVKSQITIEVQFTPINRGAQVSGRSY